MVSYDKFTGCILPRNTHFFYCNVLAFLKSFLDFMHIKVNNACISAILNFLILQGLLLQKVSHLFYRNDSPIWHDFPDNTHKVNKAVSRPF